ncbi:MAG: hypothetical protein ACO1QB_17375 [Verrucomicrobiales bacterium]
MGLPETNLVLPAKDVEELNHKLSTMRHNINNQLALIVASVEVIRRKPERGPQLMENIALQPDRIIEELRRFTAEFEKTLGITQGNDIVG